MRVFHAWLATRLVALYPRRWRDRYEKEFRATLEECSVLPRPARGIPFLIDVALGALDAHLNYGHVARRAQARRSRRQRRTAFIAACVLLSTSGGAVTLIGPFRPARAFLP
jgi:hypothetical protein